MPPRNQAPPDPPGPPPADGRGRRLDVALLAATAIFAILIWWPTRRLPYHWDAAAFVVRAARHLLATGFSPFVAEYSDFAHPPLFVATLAALWRVLGESRLVAHALVLPFLPALLAATYLLGRQVADRAVGTAAALVVAVTPVVVSEVGEIYVDLPLAALVAWGLVAYHARRPLATGLLLSAAALVKLPALLVPAVLAAFCAVDRGRRSARWLAALAAPFLVHAAWLAYHYAATGWLLTRPGRGHAPFTAARALRDVGFVARELLLGQHRALLVVAGLAALVALWVRGRRPPEVAGRVAPLAACVAAGAVFYGVLGEFGQRYGIFLLPAHAVASLALVRAALPRPLFFSLPVVAVAALSVAAWHPDASPTSTYRFRPDDDLGYLDLIRVGQQAARFVEEQHPDATIYGAFPESYQVTEPFQGYVTRSLRFIECRQAGAAPPAGEVLVYVHLNSRSQRACPGLVRALGARLLATFESGGKWVSVYAAGGQAVAP